MPLFWNRVSCSLGWHQICFEAEDNSNFWCPCCCLPCSDHRCSPSHWLCGVLGMELSMHAIRAGCQSRCSPSPDYLCFVYVFTIWNPSLSILVLEIPSFPTHFFLFKFPPIRKKRSKTKTGQSINKNESLLFKLQLLHWIGRSVLKGVYLSNEVAFINCGFNITQESG